MGYEPSPQILATPFAELAPIIQDGLVQQTIKTSLQGNLLYGVEFTEMSPWLVNLGQTTTIPRRAPIAEVDEPSNPKQDPDYAPQKYEETEASVSPYKNGIKIDMLENSAIIEGYFVSQMNELGKNAANSINSIRRKALYSGYLGGHAVALADVVAGTSLRVSQVCGFRKQIDSDGKWLNVSADNPKPILIGASTYALVTGVAADSAIFPDGRGTLTLSAVASWSVNDAVVAMDAPYRVYQGGGTTVDAISSTDILTFESIRDVLAQHSENGVPPHADGTYWVHMAPRTKNQLWSDPEFQNAIRGGVETTAFQNYTLYKAMGCTFIENNKAPSRSNTGALQDSRLSTTNGKLAKGIYSEVTNRNNQNIGYTLITGGGLGKTWYMPQGKLKSAAGLNAQEFYGMTVSADNMQIVVENMIRFLVAAPRDDMRQMVPANWQFIGSFMLWNDLFGGKYSPNDDPAETRNPYYKRAGVVVHAAA